MSKPKRRFDRRLSDPIRWAGCSKLKGSGYSFSRVQLSLSSVLVCQTHWEVTSCQGWGRHQGNPIFYASGWMNYNVQSLKNRKCYNPVQASTESSVRFHVLRSKVDQLQLFYQNIAFEIFHSYLEFKPERDSKSGIKKLSVGSTVVALANLDAFIASVVSCLSNHWTNMVEEHRQKL